MSSNNITIGIDLGDRQHAACVLSAAGDILAELNIVNTRSPAIICQSRPIGSVRFRRYKSVDRGPKVGDARWAVIFDRNGSEESISRQLDGGPHMRHRMGHSSGLRGFRVDRRLSRTIGGRTSQKDWEETLKTGADPVSHRPTPLISPKSSLMLPLNMAPYFKKDGSPARRAWLI